jgi:hypothetical protein
MHSVLFLVLAALTAADSDWSNLSRELKTGDRIDVVRSNMKSLSGQFRSATSDQLTVTVDGAGEQAINKQDVMRVSVHKGSHRLRNAILLGVVGAVAGAGAGRFGVGCAESNNGCRNAALAPIGGGAVGAAIGALIPSSAKHVVYRADKKP